MYPVLEVARYIVNYCNDKNYSISNLKLQKLLYFVQAYFLIASPNKEPCFGEAMEAWDFGPVVPVVYSEFKRFGGTNIPKISNYYINTTGKIFDYQPVKFENNVISDNDKVLINDVLEKFKWYTAADLVNITHNQDPWIKAYANGRGSVIGIESMRSYFTYE